MGKDRSLVRASDIGLWGFCHRAYWLAQVRGAEHQNPAALQYGSRSHAAHGARVKRASWLRTLGLAALAIGLALLVLLVVLAPLLGW